MIYLLGLLIAVTAGYLLYEVLRQLDRALSFLDSIDNEDDWYGG